MGTPPPPLTLGTAQLGLDYGIANRSGPPDARGVEAILETALELGVRSFDTATDYGESERRLGDFFRRRGRIEDVVLVSKLPRLAARGVDPDELTLTVARAVDSSRRLLGADHIDYYLVHDTRDLRELGQPLVEALSGQVDRGAIGAAGVSVYDPEDAGLALRHPPLAAIQFPLNLFDRRIVASGMLARLAAGGFTTFARSPYLQGLFAMAPDALPSHLRAAAVPLEELRTLAASQDLSPLDVALAFAARQPGVDSVVVGVDTPRQLHENADRLHRALTDGFMQDLRDRFAGIEPAVIDPRRWNREERSR